MERAAQLERIVRIREVIELTGLSKSSVYRLIRNKELPKPVRISRGTVGIREGDVQRFLDSRKPAEDGETGPRCADDPTSE